MLIAGQAGSGKTTIARIMGKPMQYAGLLAHLLAASHRPGYALTDAIGASYAPDIDRFLATDSALPTRFPDATRLKVDTYSVMQLVYICQL
ncbi:uncharacterized protein AMSG_09659 [Thecamonas trahens ATCC 50062]|uniref:Uncharacterized protein n=1 Tax=Thecamonas trahens ATCC 50062 TaxID=461836 RepID=A0A0L0DPQ5_THETB|nr:hypothetical protein AMSG_09659 [Thecamonas trahens ATCC 50062]KNC54006.1 hypothetical protein AMSG_09659 [Thecamonas trahens ATCC 50062]|eukprot:XP_013754021.1 hypothetical protein AMSG_09659 [Thecamonas trahens ATCC 50062]